MREKLELLLYRKRESVTILFFYIIIIIIIDFNLWRELLLIGGFCFGGDQLVAFAVDVDNLD